MDRIFLPILVCILSFSMQSKVWAQNPVITSPDIRYDISRAVYAGNSEELDVSDEETEPQAAEFSDDGSILFVLGKQGSTIIQYDLGVAYDISTGTYSGLAKEFYVGNECTDPRSFVFNDDGTRLFVIGGTDQFVYEYQLSTAYAVSSATYSGNTEGLDINMYVDNAYDLAFNNHGDILVVLDLASKAVVEFTLTSSFDISTASYAGATEELSVSSEESQPLGLVFSDTGDKLFVSGRSKSIVPYSLSTTFDVSTASYGGETEELSIGEGENYPNDLFFDKSGLELSVVGSTNDAVLSYHLVYGIVVNENLTADVIDIEANDGQGGVNDGSITYTVEGTDAAAFVISSLGVLTFKKGPDFENPDDTNTDNLYDIEIVVRGQVLSTNLHMQIEVKDVPDTPIIENHFFDISTGTYKGATEDLSVSGEDSNPLGLSFNGDGSKIFILGNQGDEILSYSLSSSYDVSTASYDGPGTDFSVTSEESNPFGFAFKPDGTKLFVVGLTDQSIVSYSLSTPFDLSSASHDGQAAELFVGNEESEPTDFTFNDDGSKLFVTGTADNSIVEYDLSINFMVNSATHAGAIEELSIEGEDNPYGVSFNDNGSRLFVVGGDKERIKEYYLTQPYDVSTAIYAGDNQTFSVSDQESEPVDLAFNGNTLYVLGVSGGKVYEYELRAVVSYIENKTEKILDVQANNGQGGAFDQGVTYALTGVDAGYFSIDVSGNIHFSNAPDFETPLDEGNNNVYDFNIVVDNGINTTELPFNVRVDDVPDVPIFETEFQGSYDVFSGLHSGTDQELDLSFYRFWVPVDFEFSADGKKVFSLMSRRTWDYVFEFDLSVPFDLSTAGPSINSERFYVTNEEPTPKSLKFNNDGTKLFIVGSTGKSVIEYNLSTPFDVSTSISAGKSEELYVGDEVKSPGSMEFSNDGTRLFFASGFFDNDIFSYKMDVPFDVSTATYEGKYLISHNIQSGPIGFTFDRSGNRMFVVDWVEDRIAEFELNKPYDISTATYSGEERELDLSGQDSQTERIKFDRNGSKLFVLGGISYDIIEYELPAGTVVKENTSDALEFDANNGMGGTTDTGISYSLGGEDSDKFKISASGQLTFLSSPDFENPVDNDKDNIYEVKVSTSNSFNTTSKRINVEVSDVADFPVFETKFNSSYNVSLAQYVDSGYKTGFRYFQYGFDFSDDGKKLFVLGINRYEIREFPLEVPFKLESAGLPTNILSVQTLESQPRDLTFSEDGAKLFVLGAFDDSIHEFNLSSPYDISTAVSAGPSEKLNIGNEEKGPLGFAFSEDGYRLYVSGSSRRVWEYQLTTPFDVSTGSRRSVLDVSNHRTEIKALTFNSGGTKLFVCGINQNIYEYSLTSPFDLQSATYSGPLRDFYVGDRQQFPRDLTFSDDGFNLFLFGGADGKITEYDIPAILYFSENQLIPISDIDANDGKGGSKDVGIKYSLEGVDAHHFSITNNGTIGFKTTPDYESPLDENKDNIYSLTLSIDNDLHIAKQILTIQVLDVDDEKPAFTSGFSVSSPENISDLAYKITTNEPATYSLGNGNDESLFTLLKGNEVHFVSVPDYENPGDADKDNQYLVKVLAEDNAGNKAAMELKVTITDKDEISPSITSANSVLVNENTTSAVYTTQANEAVTFSLSGVKDGNLFQISNNGELSFVKAPDFESPMDSDNDNIYNVEIIATDNSGNSITFLLRVTVKDVDEIPPVFTSSSAVQFVENQIAVAYKATTNESVNYSLGTMKDESLFNMEEGAINFKLAPNFENPFDKDKDNVYKIDIIAADAAGNITTLEVTITVTDVDEVSPVFTSGKTVQFMENENSAAYRAESNGTVTFSLGTLKDEAFFSNNDGIISFVQSPDFENPLDKNKDNSYEIDVIARDAANNATTLEVAIKVTDVDEVPPSFTSANTVQFLENENSTVYVAEANETVTFTLGTLKDEALFSSKDGVISFVQPPDFENPSDGNQDNDYLLDISAVDVTGNLATMELKVTVIDVDENNFTITSPDQIEFEENGLGVVYMATSDAEVTYTLGSMLDESHFVLTGDELSFLSVPDFENPLDVDRDNRYIVELIARNSSGQTQTKLLTIEVLDIDELQIAGDMNGDGVIGEGEIAGDINGDGIIGSGEIAGDVNGDGLIGAGEVAGDINGDGLINGGEGARVEGTVEIAGDVSGDGIINNDEIAGDIDGDKDITGDEIAGDIDGDQTIGNSELAGDIDGNGIIGNSEALGDTDGNGTIDNNEVEGDSNGDGTINSDEQVILSANRNDQLTFYPNPVSKTLFIQIPPSLNVKSAMITDLSGRTVQVVETWNTGIEVVELNAGLYLIQLTTSSSQIRQIFIKE